MSASLSVTIGQASDKGVKEINQDFHGALIPAAPLSLTKGIALAVADGISSSQVGGEAAQAAIKSFLSDYYCTSESWTVKSSAQRVLAAVNSWLHAQSLRGQHRYDRDRGWVCTFSGLILKSATAYLFHVGDSRIWRLSGGSLEQLTTDHRIRISSQQSYLGRALGVNAQVEIDYQAVPIGVGDLFVLTTDGLHEHLNAADLRAALDRHGDNLDGAAYDLLALAIERGSDDNLTLQLVRIDQVPGGEAGEVFAQGAVLPPPPPLEPGMELDGLSILRVLHANARSHIHLARDTEDGRLLAIKTPSVDLRGDADYLRRFLMEDWVARRLSSPHVVRAFTRARRPTTLYVLMDYVEGQTLTQWMADHPDPSLEQVRAIIEQVAWGLRAFHRKEMLHQDLRPDNVMIDPAGTARIIDFGSVRVAGVQENHPDRGEGDILGTVQFTAPEYFLGDVPGPWSDVFSLGVMTYQMLSGRLPFGSRVNHVRTRRDLSKLTYAPLSLTGKDLPGWLDGVIEKAVHPDPAKRYQDSGEFIHDLRHPGPDHPGVAARSLLDGNPFLFWKAACLLLGLSNLALLARLAVKAACP